MSSTLFLRRVLALDSLSCLAMGAAAGLGAAALAPLFGLPEPLIRIAGLLLLPLGRVHRLAGLAARCRRGLWSGS